MNRIGGMVALALAAAAGSAFPAWAQALGGAGGQGNGQNTRGISFVTRRTPMIVPDQGASGFFAAGGLPLNPPTAVGGRAFGGGAGGAGGLGGGVVVAAAEPAASAAEPALTPEASAALARFARSGDPGARWAMAQLHPEPSAAPVENPAPADSQ